MMEELPNTIIKEEKTASDDEDNAVKESSLAEEVVKKETLEEDERGETILCDSGPIKEEYDDGEEREMEIVSVMLPEFVDEDFENEGGNIQEDVLRVKKVAFSRPGPKSRKRKTSESSQDLDWTPEGEGSKLQQALLEGKKRNLNDTSPGQSSATPVRYLPATETSGADVDNPAYLRPTTRPVPQTYRDTEISEPDNFLHCDECAGDYEGDCPEHGPLNIVEDVSVLADIGNKSRASETAPPLVVIGDSRIPGAGCGVRAHDTIPPRTRFGPYEGISVPVGECTSYSWLIRKDGEASHCVDATELGLSNWLRFVNCARNELERNLVAFQYDGRIYYRTVCQVDPGEELLVWCGREFGRQLGIHLDASEVVAANSVKGTYGSAPEELSNAFLKSNRESETRSSAWVERFNQSKKSTSGHLTKDLAESSDVKPTIKNELLCTNEKCSQPNTRREYRKLMDTHQTIRKEFVPCPDERYDDSNEYILGSDPDALQTDQQLFNPEETHFACSKCEETFADEETLASHLQTHAGDNPLVCDFCSERFFDQGALTSHLLTHSGGTIFVCGECRKQFSERQLLANHLKTHSKESSSGDDSDERSWDDPFVENDEQFVSQRNADSVQTFKRFACEHCSLRFRYRSDYEMHARTHTGERPFVCHICSKSFTRKATLMNHFRSHTGERPFECDVCKQRFFTKDTLRAHQRTHSGEKPYECEECKESFSNRSYLKKHYRVHTGEKPYQCTECDQKFSSGTVLKGHMMLHTGQKLFVCDECKRSFATRQSLRKHLLTHFGEKNFVCDVCDQRFLRKDTWQHHQRSHTGEKIYDCKDCDKKFSQRRSLKHHLKTVHEKDE